MQNWLNRYRIVRHLWRRLRWDYQAQSQVQGELYRSIERLEAERDALKQQLEAALAAADPDLSDYYEPAIVVTELQREVDALRAQLAAALAAAQWQPVTAETAPVHISRPFKAVVQMSREGDLFIAQPDASGMMSDDATVIMLRPGPNHAFCERNPAAQVWTPLPDGDYGIVNVSMNGSRIEADPDRPGRVPSNVRLCELVAANGEGDANA